jgi:hypothetical protein
MVADGILENGSVDQQLEGWDFRPYKAQGLRYTPALLELSSKEQLPGQVAKM